ATAHPGRIRLLPLPIRITPITCLLPSIRVLAIPPLVPIHHPIQILIQHNPTAPNPFHHPYVPGDPLLVLQGDPLHP
ncbi:hypothetical protein KXX41_004619, partial [Aspergillus fumigatus]